LLHKQDGKRATWEYPFAVAGLNISFMLIQMLDLKAGLFSPSQEIICSTPLDRGCISPASIVCLLVAKFGS